MLPVFIMPALAQCLLSEMSGDIPTATPNEALNESCGEINSTTAYTPAVAPPLVLPDAPARQATEAEVADRVIDKKFIAVMAALGGAESLRFTTHKLVLDHEFAAGAPWVTSVPSNQHLVARYAAIYAAELLVAYELKKPHSWLPGDRVIRKLWWAYPAAMVPIHIKNGVRSIRTRLHHARSPSADRNSLAWEYSLPCARDSVAALTPAPSFHHSEDDLCRRLRSMRVPAALPQPRLHFRQSLDHVRPRLAVRNNLV